MYCKNCGKEIEDNSTFCRYYGSSTNDDFNNYTKINYCQITKPENKTIGILAIVFSVLGGWLGLVFAIIGICTYKEKETKQLCKIAFIITGVWVVIFLLLLTPMIPG